jgi:hypothetical protein
MCCFYVEWTVSEILGLSNFTAREVREDLAIRAIPSELANNRTPRSLEPAKPTVMCFQISTKRELSS